jgi:hypothetical protein
MIRLVLLFYLIVYFCSSCSEDRIDMSISMAEYDRLKQIEEKPVLFSIAEIYSGYIFGKTYTLQYLKKKNKKEEIEIYTSSEDLFKLASLQFDVNSILLVKNDVTDKFNVHDENIELLNEDSCLITNKAVLFEELNCSCDYLTTSLKGEYLVPVGMTSKEWSRDEPISMVYYTPGIIRLDGYIFKNPIIVLNKSSTYIFAPKTKEIDI